MKQQTVDISNKQMNSGQSLKVNWINIKKNWSFECKEGKLYKKLWHFFLPEKTSWR